MTDSTAKLKELIEMLREGFITREEFDIQKAKLMAADAGESQSSEPVDALAGRTRRSAGRSASPRRAARRTCRSGARGRRSAPRH